VKNAFGAWVENKNLRHSAGGALLFNTYFVNIAKLYATIVTWVIL